MRCEIVAVGSELVLGDVVDTNSSWLSQRLALLGVECHFHTAVGDVQQRIVDALRTALGRADVVIVTGGLGPTPDDITREAVAEVLGTGLRRDPEMMERIRGLFEARGREMPESNLRQADLPEGASFIPQAMGTAPGLRCHVGTGTLYVVPGVPAEMREMAERAVLPDLRSRQDTESVILTRQIRTWGLSESALAERIAARSAHQRSANPVIAYQAGGAHGIVVRLTATGADQAAAEALLDAKEAELRELLGHVVFGVDDESMEEVAGRLLADQGLSIGAAESLTGGLVGDRLTVAPGASGFFRGSIVSYHRQVKYDLLGVPEGPVVSEEAARAMALGARKVLAADVGISATGVAGPSEQDGRPVGTVFLGMALDDDVTVVHVRLPGGRDAIRELATISLLDLLRRRLLERQKALEDDNS